MRNLDIDLGDNKQEEQLLVKNKSISFLLGAGFSAPKGYPIGNGMNNGLLNFDDKDVDFSPSGELVISKNGRKPQFQIEGVYNVHQKYFIFCKRLIKEYSIAHDGKFDYELFYDFIKSDEVKEKRYQVLCDDLLSEFESFEYYLFNVPHIYNQMVEYLLKDREGKNRYDDEPFKINNVDWYNGFLDYLSQLSHEYIINVHTLKAHLKKCVD